ncbi:MAG: hypothetical protein WD772_10430 [Pseudohongiellaceae bacterium]
MQGQHRYETGLGSAFIGQGNLGNITDLVAGFEIDFDNGAITNGNLFLQMADQSWSVDFAGNIVNGVVDLNTNSGQITSGASLISNSVDASLGGAFTGSAAESFVGGFEMLDAMNPLNHVNGLFTIER